MEGLSICALAKARFKALFQRWLLYIPWGFESKLNSYLRWTPHPVIVTIRDNKDYITVLLYSSYTTITGWGVLLAHTYIGYTGLKYEPENLNSKPPFPKAPKPYTEVYTCCLHCAI